MRSKEELKVRAREYQRKWMANNLERNRENHKKWIAANLKKHKENVKKWKEANKEKIATTKRRYRLKKYGITVADYNARFTAQNGLCAICGKADTSKYKLAVDHDHITRKVRGLLCGRCNTAIGLMDEDIDVLISAISYLKGGEHDHYQ